MKILSLYTRALARKVRNFLGSLRRALKHSRFPISLCKHQHDSKSAFQLTCGITCQKVEYYKQNCMRLDLYPFDNESENRPNNLNGI